MSASGRRCAPPCAAVLERPPARRSPFQLLASWKRKQVIDQDDGGAATRLRPRVPAAAWKADACIDRVPDSGRVDAGPVSLRRATLADAAGVARVWLRSFGTALPTVRQVHTREQVHG